MRFPSSREPALFGKQSPRGRDIPIMRGTFGDCAWVLARIWAPGDCENLWIDCRAQRLKAKDIKIGFEQGKIKRFVRHHVYVIEIDEED